MKRFFVLFLISLGLLTGCNVSEINIKDIDKSTDTILGKKLNLYNQTSKGYKYYLPRGVRMIDNSDFNEKLFSDGYAYYLYVDVVSYYFKKDSKYEENEDAYLSKKLSYNDKTGYLEINKIKNLYFIEMMYNYAKIEAFVAVDDIKEAVINASYILSSLKFNDTIIKMMYDENVLNFNEEQFKLFEPKRKEGNFLDYVKEYDQYEGTIDEDLLTPDSTSDTEGAINSLLE